MIPWTKKQVTPSHIKCMNKQVVKDRSTSTSYKINRSSVADLLYANKSILMPRDHSINFRPRISRDVAQATCNKE